MMKADAHDVDEHDWLWTVYERSPATHLGLVFGVLAFDEVMHTLFLFLLSAFG
jgi:hypothetical protein